MKEGKRSRGYGRLNMLNIASGLFRTGINIRGSYRVKTLSTTHRNVESTETRFLTSLYQKKKCRGWGKEEMVKDTSKIECYRAMSNMVQSHTAKERTVSFDVLQATG